MTRDAENETIPDRLFDQKERTNPQPRSHGESAFGFLNRVSGAWWTPVRDLCEDWYSKLLDEMKADVRARFRSADERQSRSAFWEMYLYVAFSKLGYQLRPHPEVPTTNKRPDFWVERDDAGFFLEATYSTPSDHEVSASRREEAVYEALDRLKNRDFWLQIEVERQGEESLAASKLRKRLDRELSEHDAAALHRALEAKEITHRDLPLITWDDKGWTVEVRALPKPAEVRGDTSVRPVGIMGPCATWADDRASLLRTLEGKAWRYGKLGAPYLLAVRLDGLTVDRRDILDALFGQPVATVRRTPTGEHTITRVREPNGLWKDRGGPRATQLSGVMFAYDSQPALVCRVSTEPFICTNPWAEHPLPRSPWSTLGVDLQTGRETSSRSEVVLHELFGLDEGWPGPDDERFAD